MIGAGGSVRRTPLQCSSRNSLNEKYQFLMISNIHLPVNSQYLAAASAKDHELACLNDPESCREFSRVLTTIRGTLGYLAPEGISGLAITKKADVYSYGMMLLEVISGRRNTLQTEDESCSFFPILAAKKVENMIL